MIGEGNDSNEKVVNTYKLYTGVAIVKPVAINPDKEAMNTKLGIESTSEPVYTGTDKDGAKRTRIDIWVEVEHSDLKGKDAYKKIPFWMSDKYATTSSGKFQYINKYGQAAIVNSAEELNEEKWKWFSQDNLRPALEGEITLINFLINYLNLKPGEDPAQLEDPSKIANGDLTEIKKVMGKRPNNKLQVLFTVKVTDEGNMYQSVNTKVFGRVYTTQQQWIQFLQDSYKQPPKNETYQDDIHFQEFKANPAKPDNKENNNPYNTEKSTDNLPF